MKFNETIHSVTAFAPATCGNAAVGFDILGFAIDGIGDTITLTRTPGQALNIEEIVSKDDLPHDVEKNIASAVISNFCQRYHLSSDFSLQIHKGLSLGSGMGGSAASAVAALLALNHFLEDPCDLSTLAEFAIEGEGLVSGGQHGDNVVPCLYGGMTLITNLKPLQIKILPIKNLYSIVIHPHLRVDTKDARSILPKTFELNNIIQQSMHLSGFISAIYEEDIQLMRHSLKDCLIEPYRSRLIPGFAKVKQSAIDNNALGTSLSGSGPSIFALAANTETAKKIEKAMLTAFAEEAIACDAWVSSIRSPGAKIVNVVNKDDR